MVLLRTLSGMFPPPTACRLRCAPLLIAALTLAPEVAAQTVDWIARRNGVALDTGSYPGSGEVGPGKRAIAVGPNGTIYVTGQTENGSVDYLTVAYDSAGSVLWWRTKNGLANGTDQAYALAVDAAGNVFVTGQSYNGSNYDFLTVAYDSAGNELWVRARNGAGAFQDSAYAIGVDAVGNVYVTGRSWGGSSGFDYLTVAYDSAGTELWARVKNGAGNGEDGALSLATDAIGRVYVTGYSVGASGSDYLTVAYDSAGNELWARARDGGASSSDGATAVAADDTGRVFVTGYSHNGTSFDCLTVAYDSAGLELWAAVKDGAAGGDDRGLDLVLDGAGHALVAGYTTGATGVDFLTVAYDGAGSELWVRSKNGSAGGSDQAFGVAVDSAGNVHVIGSSHAGGFTSDFLTVTYDGAGNELWAKVKNGGGNDQAVAVAVDGQANVYSVGFSFNGSNADYLTVAYDAAGNELWAAKEPPVLGYEDRPGSGDAIHGKRALAVSAGGEPVVTGRSWNGFNYDYLTVAYDGEGAERWSQSRNGAADDRDEAFAVAMDASGNAYVTGRSSNGTNDDFLTVAYDSAGNEIWARVKNGAANDADQAVAVAVDASGNVYVAGLSSNGSNDDFLTVAYDSAGNELWARTKDGTAGGQESVYGIAAEAGGNVYVTGYSSNGSNLDFLTVAYDSTGNERWTRARNGTDNGDDAAYALALDADGNVFVTGVSLNTGTNDYLTVAYDSAGNELWARWKNFAWESAYAVVAEGGGNVVVTGISSNGPLYDYLTVAYDSAGNELWAKVKNGAANNDDQAFGLASDASGNVYVAGQSSNGANIDYLTVAYDGAGSELWQHVYDGGGVDSSYIAVVSGGGLFVSGSSFRQNMDYLTIKYSLADDTTPPSDPAIDSTAPSASAWSNDNTVTASWSGAADELDGSGLDGYSIEWNTAPLSTPDAVVDVDHTVDPHSADSPPLADGVDHYFHLSTCDHARNCTSGLHAGPFWIDTTPPASAGSIASDSHAIGVAAAAPIVVAWPAATDAASAVDGYSFAFDGSSAWVCDEVKDVEESTLDAASPGLSDGVWYFHLCAVDHAGNWSAVSTGGPYSVGAVETFDSTLVSHVAGSPSVTADAASSGAWISDDGRYVAFSSLATDLVGGGSDSNGVPDAFFWDRETGLVTLISAAAGAPGTAANGESTVTAMTPDGGFVAFHSTASDLVAAGSDANGANDAFLWERATGAVTLVSHTAGLPDTTGDEISYTYPGGMSADGEFVIVYSNATNLVAGAVDVSATTDAFVWQRSTGALTYVSHQPAGATVAAAGYSVPTAISADGAFVGFYTQATNLVAGVFDTNGVADAYLWERATGTVTLVSHVAGDPSTTADGATAPSYLSLDGRFAALESLSSNLVAGLADPNGSGFDVFVHDRLTGATELVSGSAASSSQTGDGPSHVRALTPDGRFVLMTSDATDLVTGVVDVNGESDVFLRDRQVGTTVLVSRWFSDWGLAGDRGSVAADVSSDGRYVLLESRADLAPELTDLNGAGAGDAFLLDRTTGVMTLLSHEAEAPSVSGDGGTTPLALTPSGSVALLASSATNLGWGVDDPNGAGSDLYIAAAVAADSTAPADPTVLSAQAPHAEWGWSNQPSITMEWSGATDGIDGSGLDGYSVEWSTTALETPDAVVDVPQSADPHSLSAELTEGGGHYFHLRTCDLAANCTSTLHRGPYGIDLTSATAPGPIVSPSHGDGLPHSDATIDVQWNASADALSGVDGYSILFDQVVNTGCARTAKDVEEGVLSMTSPPLGDGTWWVHVCPVDNAGNWGAPYNVSNEGPYVIDTASPSAPGVVTSASHDGGASDDPTIDVAWGASSDGSGPGVVSYRFDFGSSGDSPACEDLGQGTLSTSTTSAALAAGVWYLHVCAVDEAGNESTVTTGGPYTIDLSAPKVSNVDSVVSSGGSIGEGEIVNVEITELFVGFDEAMAQTPAETLSNYLLVEAGVEGTLETADCSGVAATDFALAIDSATYAGTTATLAVSGGATLADGLYRLIACPALEDVASNALDGDGDGVGGDAFVRTFRVDLSAPSVIEVDSVADTGDGQLAENEVTNVAITELHVTFSEAIVEAVAESSSEWMLVGSGSGSFETVDCAGGVLGDDFAVGVDAITWGGPSLTATLEVNGSAALADGRYRLFACASLKDLGENPLDGDGDGAGGDDFARSFQVDTTAPSNPVLAPSLPAGVWTNLTGLTVTWSGAADDPDGSGLAGYSVLFDLASGSDPGTGVDVGEAAAHQASAALADAATHHFHLRACDLAGNCATAIEVGPFQVDTQAPAAASGLASSSHDVGVASNDSTIEVSWSPAEDQPGLSGIDGYGFAFVPGGDDNCDGVMDSEEDQLSTVSEPLAEGEWWFHLCARDNAGNWGPRASIGPFVIDTSVAVVSIGTVADTGDGVLDEGEATLGGITQLLVEFDGAMADPAGDSASEDVTNPANYRLLEAGGDGTLSTATCAAPAGDDVAVAVVSSEYLAASTTAVLRLAGSHALDAGSYRLLVCPTLENEAGSAISPLQRDFSVTLRDELGNPNFDGDLAGWVVTETTPGSLAWSAGDAGGASSSGSAEILTASGVGEVWGLSQCFELPAGPFLGWARVQIESAAGDAPAVELRLDFYDAASCGGGLVESTTSAPAVGDSGGLWSVLELQRTAEPSTSQSVLVTARVLGGTAASFTARIDDLLYGRPLDLLSDGFETGDFRRWGSAVGEP